MATATISLSQLGQDAGAWQEIDSAGNGNDSEMHSNDWDTAGDWSRRSENVSGADSAVMPYSSSEHMLGDSLGPHIQHFDEIDTLSDRIPCRR